MEDWSPMRSRDASKLIPRSREAAALLQAVELLQDLSSPALTKRMTSDIRRRARAILASLPPRERLVRWGEQTRVP